MESPKNLSHKPVVSVNDYDKIDAQYIPGTDVRALSIGNAQYDRNEVSLKVWRHTGKRWSRQSEEIPLHRNLDLNILLLGALMSDVKSGYPQTNLREVIDCPVGLTMIKKYYSKNKVFLKPRLEELRSKLNDFLDSYDK